MPMSREKYRRIPDLYTQGTELVFEDGTVMWLQAVNPLQRDEAQHDAQVARSRLVMALKKTDNGSDERVMVEGAFLADGREEAIERLVQGRLAESLMKTLTSVQDDPDWKERLEILDRTTELVSRPVEDAERQLVEQINEEYITEVRTRQSDEEAYLRQHYADMPDEDLVEDYIDLYVERRGNDVAVAEYTLTELWYAARCCEGVKVDGAWDHSGCDHHVVQAYESKAEVRALPEEMHSLLAEKLGELNMNVRTAKNSDRQRSSSDSSPLPSEAGASTPSTQIEIPSEPPGTSPSLSAMPSAS